MLHIACSSCFRCDPSVCLSSPWKSILWFPYTTTQLLERMIRIGQVYRANKVFIGSVKTRRRLVGCLIYQKCAWAEGKSSEKVQSTDDVLTDSTSDNFSDEAFDDIEDHPPGTRRRPLFNNMVLTDGFTVNILLTRATSSTKLPDLELEDIAKPHVAQYFDLWGADPGLKDIFVATDGQQQYRKFSAAEYRCKTGQTRRKAARDRLQRQANITTIESAIPTTKTSSSSSFIAAVRYILENLSPLLALYGDVMWAQHRLWNYSGAQKLDHEMVQIFLNGGRKYDPSTAPHPTMQHRTSAHPT